ncbi:MAG: HipA domain-containing protein [Propionibacteriaceae bacterium]|nr:HipA domain-containing protein [Propionibacteriaceae bacterium]
MTSLTVFVNGSEIGHLRRIGPTIRFEYSPAHLATPSPMPLSLSMPLREGPQPQRATIAWLQGLLPASLDVRNRLAQRFQVKAHDLLGLVLAVGLDLPGAVQVARHADDIDHRHGSYEPLTPDDVAARVRGLRRDEPGWLLPDEAWSLGGAQGKFTLYRDASGTWHAPKGSAPSSHIVKLGTNRARLSALNEHVCLETYRSLGLPAARSEALFVDDEPVIVVERFDRSADASGVITRRHQEDLCQALGHQFAYTSDGGPAPGDIISLLHTQPSSRDRFVRQLIANLLIGSPDGHARNYSVLLAPGGFALTPAYDVASSLPYDPIPGSHDPMHLRSVAMPIGGERSFHAIGRQHWERFLRHNLLDPDHWLPEVGRLAAELPLHLEQVLRASGSAELTDRMLPRVLEHCRSVAARALN